MRYRAIGPVGRHTKPCGELLEVAYRKGLTIAKAVEERAAADDDRGYAGKRLAAPSNDFSVIRIGDRSQCVLVCVVHAPLCVVNDALVNGGFAARDALRRKA